MDIDFSEGQILPVNQQVILSGSAVKAAIPDSYYSPETGWANARYFGSDYTGQYNYSQSFATSSFPVGYPIDNFVNYFIYYDWIGGADPQYPGGGNLHGVYLISTEGIATPLTAENKNLFTIENIFIGGQTAYISPAVYSSGKPSSIPVKIVDGGAIYETILLVTGSAVGTTSVRSLYAYTDQNIEQNFRVYFTGSNNTLTDSGSVVASSFESWIYAFSNPSSSVGIIEYFSLKRPSLSVGADGVSIYNKTTGQYINNLNLTPSESQIVNYVDTYFPLQYGDMIRFGTTGSYSVDNTASLDGTFSAGGLFQISSILTGSNMTQTSSINIVPTLNNFTSSSISSKNTQNFRMMRRIQNESFVLIQNKPSYLDPGFLIPFNFNPNYNPYELAKKAGVIQ
jgi:hypothetical protein